MRLDDLDPSRNVRDQGFGGGGFGGGGFGGARGGMGGLIGLLPLLMGRKLGCGSILLIGLALLAFSYFGGGGMMGAAGPGVATGQQQGDGRNVACDTQAELFACRVLASTEQTWGALFAEQGQRYRPTTLTFYQQSGQSGCGAAQSAMGPFYCPSDQGVYLDTSFFQEMRDRLGASGDFAQAYVVAHEVGHHVQNLTGTATQVRQAQARAGQAEGNALQVRMELQADCYAGVWAARNRDRIEPGDVEEGMTAASAIGDDTLMRNAGQRPVEAMFTHGTSEQRMRWLRTGLRTGDPAACDTFSAATL